MGKDLKIGLLNELYGALLTERQYEAVKAYYDFDLSLGEIAENLGVTRQAVRDAIAKGETSLTDCERKLGIMAKRDRIKAVLEQADVAIGGQNAEAARLIRQAIDDL